MADRASILVAAEDATGPALKSVERSLGEVTKAVGILRNAFALLTGATGAAMFGQQIVAESMKAENAIKRMDAVLNAAGRNIGVSRQEIIGWSEAMSNATQFDDEAVIEAANNLIKFGNITGEVFERTLKLSADVAAFMGTDLPAAAQMLGKAVQSPTEGLKALSKEFGKLTAAEEDHIKTLAAQGRALEAQNAVLDIVKGKVGGLAEAMNTGFLKATQDVKKEFGNFLEELGKIDMIGGMLRRRLEGIADAFRFLKNELQDDSWSLKNAKALGELDNRVRELDDRLKVMRGRFGGNLAGTSFAADEARKQVNPAGLRDRLERQVATP